MKVVCTLHIKWHDLISQYHQPRQEQQDAPEQTAAAWVFSSSFPSHPSIGVQVLTSSLALQPKQDIVPAELERRCFVSW